MREPKVYTCNCKTPLYQAAPEMYEFGETTAEVLHILLERLGPKPTGLNAEIKRLAEERIAEWKKIEKKVFWKKNQEDEELEEKARHYNKFVCPDSVLAKAILEGLFLFHHHRDLSRNRGCLMNKTVIRG